MIRNQGSTPLWSSTYQFRVNGANKVTGDGWSGKNRRLAHLTDCYGDFNILQGQNWVKMADEDDLLSESFPDQVIRSAFDYTGIVIDERINELQVRIARETADAASLKQQFIINLFGEVGKAVVMEKGGSYNVVYT